MKVKLTRRWGSHKPGATVDVDPAMGAWLTSTGYGETSKGTATAGAIAPGSDGPDLRAGGDPTRLRARAVTSAGGSDTREQGQPTRRPANPRPGPTGNDNDSNDSRDGSSGGGDAPTRRGRRT